MKNDYLPKNEEKCLFCCKENKFLLTGYDYLYKTTINPFNVYKCINCGAEQIVPMPKNDELKSFYPSNYYSYNISSVNGHKKGFFMKIREKLVEVSYNKNSKRDIYYMLSLLTKHLFQGLPLRYIGNRKFLDVGCGDTYNVNLMSRQGWDSVGFEIGDKKTSKNIYYDNDFSYVDFGKIKFDCIRVWHVLEHVPNPNKFMMKLSDVTADNGKILIGIPNSRSFYALIFGRYWYNRDLPRHVINYNVVSLNVLLKKNGLKISKLSYNSAGGCLGSIQHIINSLFKSKFNLIDNVFLFCIFFPIDILSNFLKMGDCISVVVEKDI